MSLGVVATEHSNPGQLFSAGRDNLNLALAAGIGFFQEPSFGVVEIPRPAIDGQGDTLLLDQANHRLGPVPRRTASGAGTSANAEGSAAGPAPDQDRLALGGRLFPGLGDAEQPGNLAEAQF